MSRWWRCWRRRQRLSSSTSSPGDTGLDHRVHLARVQRPGLALTGYTDYIRYGRVQIVGSSEIGYLRKLTPRRRAAILAKLCQCHLTCFVVTRGHTPPTGAGLGGTGGRDPPADHPPGVHEVHQAALRLPRGAPGLPVAHPLGSAGRLRCGHPDPGRQWDRKVRVRPRLDRPRPPAGGRRRGRDQEDGRHAGGSLPGAHAIPHGVAGPRGPEHPGPLRGLLREPVQGRGPGDRAGAVGGGEGVRPPRAPRRELPDPRNRGAPGANARGPGAEHRAAGGGGGPQPAPAQRGLRRRPALRGARGRSRGLRPRGPRRPGDGLGARPVEPRQGDREGGEEEGQCPGRREEEGPAEGGGKKPKKASRKAAAKKPKKATRRQS